MTYYPVVGPIQTMTSPADQVSHISVFLIFIFLILVNIVFLDQANFVVLAFPYFGCAYFPFLILIFPISNFHVCFLCFFLHISHFWFSYFPLLICAELYFCSRLFLLFSIFSIFTDCESFWYYNERVFTYLPLPGGSGQTSTYYQQHAGERRFFLYQII